ncbi:MAG: hypothetical protein WA322_14825 [Pseudolabrys sp.]
MFRTTQLLSRACWFLFVVLTLDFGVAFGQNDTSNAYRCTSKDAVTIRDDGTFDKDPIAEARRKYYDGIVINPLTGAVTHPSNGSRENWRAIQEASTNDYVLIPEKISDVSLRAQKDAATAVTDFIRVRVGASEPQVTFLAFSLSNLVTGTCEIVR